MNVAGKAEAGSGHEEDEVPVSAEAGVGGEKGQAFGARLCDQHSVKGVTMMPR